MDVSAALLDGASGKTSPAFSNWRQLIWF